MTTNLFTIGHSNHSLEHFLGLLRRYDAEVLVDVRRFPGSRKFPHFAQPALAEALREAGLEYRWIESLGGRRAKATTAPSPNLGLRNQSFRNYADYMMTAEFRDGVEQLRLVAASRRTAIMCSESVFWRCHRRLISDYVVAQGWAVQHIFPAGDAKPHALTSEATIAPGGVIYPADAAAPP